MRVDTRQCEVTLRKCNTTATLDNAKWETARSFGNVAFKKRVIIQMSLHIVKCRFALSSIVLHCRDVTLHCHNVTSHYRNVTPHCRVLWSVFLLTPAIDNAIRRSTMQSDTRQCKATFFKCRIIFFDYFYFFYTATPANAKRLSTMRSDILIISLRIVCLSVIR